jgi:nucleotide-binding universal stress UspA family protein
MYEHILIPTDGTEETLDAVQPGFELASQHGATVHLLHVIENDMLDAVLSTRTLGSMTTTARRHGEQAVAALQDVADECGVDSVTWVLRARPSIGRRCVHETIVEYAETNGVDLIVMGATDRGRLSTMLRPSVTYRVMSTTEIPVYGRRFARPRSYQSDERSRVRPGTEFGD